ncbi:hypothetical protein J2X20_003384 [Pelomonas saccharophila]|uniref:DUF4410 domain-containing protein n=1 Tax=Roseateles saccharophilus TaxID=304 RepID=A0ABU1YR97_ROSSA|nr:hypothetical protein [Roseateles saccharophilus]MDR7270726.1 hypothetical protein [Roseateles saccharophilus]
MNTLSHSLVRRLALVAVLAAMAGCASVKMPESAPSAANAERLRAAKLAPAQLGSFKLADGKPASMDTSLSGLRGSSLSPTHGSFSTQLRDEIAAELAAAGLLDPKSKVVIEGQLTDSMVDAAIGTGKGRLAARIQVQRDGKTAFDKEVVAEATWESSFVGAVAIPRAMNQYTALYKTLVGKLFDDADFKRALAAQ